MEIEWTDLGERRACLCCTSALALAVTEETIREAKR